MKNKIAVCLCGEPRSIYLGSTFIKKYFKELDVDYFCQAWSDSTEIVPNNQNIKANIYNIKERSIIENKELYDYIKYIYDPKVIQIEDFKIDRFYGQFIAAENVINLKKNYEEKLNFKYDIVVRMRYDTAIKDINKTSKINFYSSKLNNIYVNNIRIDCIGNTRFVAISDHGPFIGSSDTMDKYHIGNYKLLQHYYNNYPVEKKPIQNLTETVYTRKQVPFPEIIWNHLFNCKDILPEIYKNIHFHVVIRYGCPVTNVLEDIHNYHVYRDKVMFHNYNKPYNNEVRFI